MQVNNAQNLDQVFSALAHPVRRSILEQCSAGRQSVADLAEPHDLSLNAISKHIKMLESAELVSRRRDGNFHRIGLRTDTLMPVLDWLSYHVIIWDTSLQALKAKLEHTS